MLNNQKRSAKADKDRLLMLCLLRRVTIDTVL